MQAPWSGHRTDSLNHCHFPTSVSSDTNGTAPALDILKGLRFIIESPNWWFRLLKSLDESKFGLD
jgi:hypothetical protein